MSDHCHDGFSWKMRDQSDVDRHDRNHIWTPLQDSSAISVCDRVMLKTIPGTIEINCAHI